jgi:hypothetical protein
MGTLAEFISGVTCGYCVHVKAAGSETPIHSNKHFPGASFAERGMVGFGLVVN